ncbi:MAG: UDP-N-acetylmuramoyl-L-alanyl-D-glutamate--2,6-diaminopimelate ligase [bacterium]|nr:UDP-N-acetylmuramoyl-L-alanyl-D-glutamate--2,6-diaminopimelate ligase [bacterium]
MLLNKLIEKVEVVSITGDANKEISTVSYDSRKATENGLFICIKGAVVDGHTFVNQVVEKGVTAIVVEDDVEVDDSVTVIKVKDARLALACISAAYFGNPAEKLTTIGITGTKGKTTTTYMIKSILEGAGFKTGLIGTIETIIGETHIPAANTTPESYMVQEYFAKMVEAGCTHVVMEVSSQGLMLHRVSGFTFDYGLFTNLEPDHIGPNEHKDFDDYLRCKQLLFKQCKHGIFNIDDEHAEKMIEGCTCDVTTFGLNKPADIKADNVSLVNENGVIGIAFDVSGKVNDHFEVDVPGKFSVYNSLAAISTLQNFNVDHAIISKVLKNVHVKGRVELIPVSNDFTLMIDYAHNAMSLESLLTTIREYNPGRIVTVFGCGGNRARSRRFEMGEISSKLSDLTIVTSDNPRFEEPKEIMEDIITGVKKADGEYIAIENRKDAIKYSIEHAKKGDIIVLAGKGHETYQEIKGVKHDMDERVLIKEVLEELQQA